jgi:hypothetical protein
MAMADEMAVVQYFTDMVQIERLASALFREQRRRVDDPTLQQIFETFVVDEERHAEVAQRLAAFYDVHHYRPYRVSESLRRFTPHFLALVTMVSDEIANVYITSGELMLDIALLRSLDDYVADPMSAQAMRLINRDESRHIAVDYHMVEYYASPAYAAKERVERARAKKSLAVELQALWTLANVVRHAKPFFHDVFFQPMARLDPRGRRLREVFRRLELLEAKPGVADRPFAAFAYGLRKVYNHPVAGRAVKRIATRLAGVDEQLMQRFVTAEDIARTRRMSFDEMAEEALAQKNCAD